MKVATIVCALVCGAASVQSTIAGPAAGPDPALSSPAAQSAAPLDPREAGARYGQALGVALVCYGMRTTGAADQLPAKYAGSDRSAFQAEADKVLAAWRDASSCRDAGGPNACRLVHEWSCRDALSEIGPQGSKIPGLIETKQN